MTDAARATDTSRQTKAGHDLPPKTGFVPEDSTRFFEDLMKSNTAVLQSTFEFWQEMLTFAQARLQANIGIWTALAACQNPSDVPACHAEFTKNAAAEYTEAWRKFGARLAGVMREAAPQIRTKA
jgi:phasin protein